MTSDLQMGGLEDPPPSDLSPSHRKSKSELNVQLANPMNSSSHVVVTKSNPDKYFDKARRDRPREFAYRDHLPFEVESQAEVDESLRRIIRNFYTAIKAEDYNGSIPWTREIQSWMNLKFDLPRSLRCSLVKLFYNLALTPGLSNSIAERYARMVTILTDNVATLKPIRDLILDWRPLWRQLKATLLPSELPPFQSSRRCPTKVLTRLLEYCPPFFDPTDRRALFEEFLPYFSTSELSNAYIVGGALAAFCPTEPTPQPTPGCEPSDYFPTLFYIWSMVARSRFFDVLMMDIFSEASYSHLFALHVPFTKYGIFTKEQSDHLFSCLLRLIEIPVGQSPAYYTTLDYAAGNGSWFDRDRKRASPTYAAALWLSSSLSPLCDNEDQSVLTGFESFISSIESFCHPSNQGTWTISIYQVVLYLSEHITNHYNTQLTGETEVPKERWLTDTVVTRVVLAIREIVWMGIFSKSSRVTDCSQRILQNITYLKPDLILPGALQRFYLGLQGVVEVHRTTASLVGLSVIAPTLVRQKGFRCHTTALLALALPGIDANDLNKTLDTLSFIQTVALSIPFIPLTGDYQGQQFTSLAMNWVTGEIERLEREGPEVELDYQNEISDEEEASILRSSTADFGSFILTFLGKVFMLLENLPESQYRSRTPESSVISNIPIALTPIFANLTDELYDSVLDKIAEFLTSHVVFQATDCMAWIVDALCRVHPKKALKIFIPMLVANIRNEVDNCDAASDRSAGTETLPRDRAFVWYLSNLSFCVLHGGAALVEHRRELLSLITYLQEKCRGLPTIHISILIHHLLTSLTRAYPTERRQYEPEVLKRGIAMNDWGRLTSAKDLTIEWHVPCCQEIDFALELYETQTSSAMKKLEELIGPNPPLRRTGKDKEWSDETSRLLGQIRLSISGMATLFNRKEVSGKTPVSDEDIERGVTVCHDIDHLSKRDPLADTLPDVEPRAVSLFKTGYLLTLKSDEYKRIHQLREDVGLLLSRVHRFLTSNLEDDVACFQELYHAYRTWVTDVGIERSSFPSDVVRTYPVDVSVFKVAGLRKPYPRSILIERAYSYLLLRQRHNSSMRSMCDLDKQLLLDLAESCSSPYSDVRRTAQGSMETALRSLISGREVVIRPIMDTYTKVLSEDNYERIIGCMNALFSTSMIKPLGRDWRFTADAIRLFLKTAMSDHASIQQLGSTCFSSLRDIGKSGDLKVFVKDNSLHEIVSQSEASDLQPLVERRLSFVTRRYAALEEAKAQFGLELIREAIKAHWKIAYRCIVFASNMFIRFDRLPHPEFIELITQGFVDIHPKIRMYVQPALSSIFEIIDMRVAYDRNLENFVNDRESNPESMVIEVPRNDPTWTNTFLNMFQQPRDKAEYFVDSDHPGWLVWGKTFRAMRVDPPQRIYDDEELSLRKQVGAMITQDWFAKFLDYLKQEPHDTQSDRIHISNIRSLMDIFSLMYQGLTVVKEEEVFAFVEKAFGEGTDLNEHRIMAELMTSLLLSSSDESREIRKRVWNFAVPRTLKILRDDMTPEFIQYWQPALHVLLADKDPRRNEEIYADISKFRLDLESNAAFKESSRIQQIELLVVCGGWHYRTNRAIRDNFLAHLDHPYKAVRESMGRSLALMLRNNYFEAFPSVEALMKANQEASSIGMRPYIPSEEFTRIFRIAFEKLEAWRLERKPGQQTPSSYTLGAKTILTCLELLITCEQGAMLIPFYSDILMEPLQHMMDVKEDPELRSLAYHVYCHLPNVHFGIEEETPLIDALVRVGKTASSWHHRIRSLINLQTVYFRRLYLLQPNQRELIFKAVSAMLLDTQLEVRSFAASTLAGLIRCSPSPVRNPELVRLQAHFRQQLKDNPMPNKRRGLRAAAILAKDSNTPSIGTPGGMLAGINLGTEANGKLAPFISNSLRSPAENSVTETPLADSQQIMRRHAAVLGLGALVEAFPYASPPPAWIPEVLTTLATQTAADAGIVGKATKGVLSDFKKTRQDSWATDQKSFTTEQLEYLEGVLWKSYFA